MSKKLILFDIDGTLVSRCIIHEKSFTIGIKEVFNIDVERPGLRFAGATEKKIIFTLLEEAGIRRDQIRKGIDNVYEAMRNYFKENIDNDNEFRLLPGVKIILKKLNKRNHIVGLLTGNTEQMARLKLKKFGINHYFKAGGFGGVTEVRNELVPIAIKKFGIKINKENIFIIGDTPQDIECGKVNNVKTIAVATGPYPKEELLKYDSDYILENLTDTDKIISIIEK